MSWSRPLQHSRRMKRWATEVGRVVARVHLPTGDSIALDVSIRISASGQEMTMGFYLPGDPEGRPLPEGMLEVALKTKRPTFRRAQVHVQPVDE